MLPPTRPGCRGRRSVDAEAEELPDDDRLAQDNPLLAQCYAASIAGVLLFDGQRRPMRLFGAPAREPRVKNGHGFDVDAAVRVPAAERQRLDKLCQVVLRPPIASDRLRALPGNQYELRLKEPWADGTTAIVMDGTDLVGRLAALVSPPRVHTVRYQFHVGRSGAGARIVLKNGPSPVARAQPGSIPRIARLVALAHKFEGMIDEGVVASMADVARLGRVTRARMTQIFDLLLLAPQIQEELLFTL